MNMLNAKTMHSMRKSVATVAALIEKASDMGVKVLGLCEDYAMTSAYAFQTSCKGAGIKPVIGVTFLMKDGYTVNIYAKDYQGYKSLMKAVKESNRNLRKDGTMIYPQMTKEILEKCFGKGSEGHGHVAALSGGYDGVFFGALECLKESAKKKETVKQALRQNEEDAKRLQSLLDQKNQIKEMEQSAEDAEQKAKYKTLGKRNTEMVNELKKALLSEEKVLELKGVLENAPAAPETKEEVLSFFEAQAAYFESVFEGDFYLEAQYLGFEVEKTYLEDLTRMAKGRGMRVVASNPAYMLDNSEKTIMATQTMRGLQDNDLKPVTDQEREMFLKTSEQIQKALENVLEKGVAEEAIRNTDAFLDSCNIEFPEKPMHYPVFDKNQDANALLLKEIQEGAVRRFPSGLPEGYKERINYEYSVIKQMGVADYLLIVQDLIRFAKKLAKMPIERYLYLKEHMFEMSYEEIIEYVEADQSGIGYVVGPGRGSAAGSEVCFDIGITDVDPIPLNLLFERFLNPERVSMPDIDTDYAKKYREVVIQYAYKKYGEDAVCKITTFGTLSAKAAVTAIARMYGKTLGEEKLYQTIGTKLSDVLPKKPHTMLADFLPQLMATAKECGHKAEEIVERAMLVEGVYNQYGEHACGVIISDNDNVKEYLPLSYDPDACEWKSQHVPAEAEEQGMLKMDFLGLKTLDQIQEIIRLVQKRRGENVDPVTIPVKLEVFENIFWTGKTNGVFQLESAGMKDICMRMKPSSYEDIILLVAAYRPGPMDSIPNIIEVKSGRKQAQYEIPQVANIYNVTYGEPIYQEQVQQTFRELAGYSYGQADNVRRAMAKKKEKVLLAERDAFVNGDPDRNIKGCVANGIDAGAANRLFDSLVSFASYAFNKSHAAVYGWLAYITAYLKHYYYEEFLSVMLEWVPKEKRIAYISEAKEHGVIVSAPDINLSTNGFEIADGKVIFGFSAINGVGGIEQIVEERKANGPYVSFLDFYVRNTGVSDTVKEKLIRVGSFDRLEKCSRQALIMYLSQLSPMLKSLKDTEKKIAEKERIMQVLKDNSLDKDLLTILKKEIPSFKNKTVPKVEKVAEDITALRNKMAELTDTLQTIEIPVQFEEDKEQNLRDEQEYLSIFLTGHPVESYDKPENTVSVENVEEGKQSVFGCITNLNVIHKERGDLAFFDLEDLTGQIHVCVFYDAYKKLASEIADGAVVTVTGKVESEVRTIGEDEEETYYQLIANNIKAAPKKRKSYLLEAICLAEFERLAPIVSLYAEENGADLYLYGQAENRIWKTSYKVASGILEEETLKVVSI